MMRRKSERNKAKSPEPKVEKPKRGRPPRRRKKSSSSSPERSPVEEDSVPDTKAIESPKSSSSALPTVAVIASDDEDSEQVWHVKTSESSGDTGEIQKLKICLSRPSSTPERPDRSPRGRKKLNRSGQLEFSSESSEEKRKSRHRSRRGSSKDVSSIDDCFHSPSKEVLDSTDSMVSSVDSQDADTVPVSETVIALESDNNVNSNKEDGKSSVNKIAVSDSNETKICENKTEIIIVQAIVSPSDVSDTVTSSQEGNVSTEKQKGQHVEEEIIVNDTLNRHLSNKDVSISTTSSVELSSEVINEDKLNSEIKIQSSKPITDESAIIQNESIVIVSSEASKPIATSTTESVKESPSQEVIEESSTMCESSKSTVTNKSEEAETVEKISNEELKTVEKIPIEEVKIVEDIPVVDNKTVEDKKTFEDISTEETKTDVNNSVNDTPKEVLPEQILAKSNEPSEIAADEIVTEPTKVLGNSEIVDNTTMDVDIPSEPLKTDLPIPKIEEENISVSDTNHEIVQKTTEPEVAEIASKGNVRKRKWGSRSSKVTKVSTLSISTDSLKNLISHVEPLSVEDVLLDVKPKEVVEVKPEKVKSVENRHSNGKYSVNEKKKEKDGIGSMSHRKISIVSEEMPIEQRPPSPPKYKSSAILYITNLVRPFTLPQLKNLLQRTGKIVENGFWIDKIKSKCYVQYHTEDEATETRHALHGVTWPISNPKTLNVDFGSATDMRNALLANEEDKIISHPEAWPKDHNFRDTKLIGKENEEKIFEKRMVVREWDVGKGDAREERTERLQLRGQHPVEGERRKRRSKSPSPARKFKKKEEEAPSKLLDDLFKKTKATPCIYWLPLNAETIMIKEEQRRKHMAEHERRMEELRRATEERVSRGNAPHHAPNHRHR